ncbi:CXXC motif containing zinc binding protein-like [Argopecten irradians]|uniref:CXXC motif containing zinc binding protein-like n=1 Tax=Argopecten irradians TaxID=31199 RepID=UPI0037108FC0
MVKIGLELKADLELVTNLRPDGEDFRWYIKVKCFNCGECTTEYQYLSLAESSPLKGGRGSASLVMKCKLCGRENSIDIIADSIKPYDIDHSGKFKTIVVFDCRGMEPVDFSPRVSPTAIDIYIKNQVSVTGPLGLLLVSVVTKIVSECSSHQSDNMTLTTHAHGMTIKPTFSTVLFHLFQDWADYDEKQKEAVGVYNIEHRFKKV